MASTALLEASINCTVTARIGFSCTDEKFSPSQPAFGFGNSYSSTPEIVTTSAGSDTVTPTSSASLKPAASVTVRRKLSNSGEFAATFGAMKLASAESALLIVTVVPLICVHENVSVSPGSTPEPFSCTTEFSTTALSTPAFAVGTVLVLPTGAPPPPPPQAASVTSIELSRIDLTRRGFLVINASYSMCYAINGAPLVPMITILLLAGQGASCAIMATRSPMQPPSRPG